MAARQMIPKLIKIHTGEERRGMPRAPLDTDALVHSQGERYLCTALDVSSSGASIRVDSLVTLERFVLLDLYLPDDSVWVDVRAEVVRAERVGQSIIWGLCFHSPDCWALSNIEGHVRERMTGQLLL